MKLILLISLILIIVISLGGLIYLNKENTSKVYSYDLSSLTIDFNGQTKDGITSVTQFNRSIPVGSEIVNNDFKEYLSKELNTLADRTTGLKSIDIENWYRFVDQASIVFNYEPNLSDNKKNTILNTVKNQLEAKWYISQIHYNTLDLHRE